MRDFLAYLVERVNCVVLHCNPICKPESNLRATQGTGIAALDVALYAPEEAAPGVTNKEHNKFDCGTRIAVPLHLELEIFRDSPGPHRPRAGHLVLDAVADRRAWRFKQRDQRRRTSSYGSPEQLPPNPPVGRQRTADR